MRLFVAAELPEAVLDALSETSALLRESVQGRFVAPDSFHMTLAFLGEVNASMVDAACDALDEACTPCPPVRIALGSLGSFGRAHKATLWQGLAAGVDELGGLAGDVRECLAGRGLAYDAAAFVPHVTLMRGADLSAGVLPMPQVASGHVSTVALFRSDLSGARPRYEALYRSLLAGPEEDQW